MQNSRTVGAAILYILTFLPLAMRATTVATLPSPRFSDTTCACAKSTFLKIYLLIYPSYTLPSSAERRAGDDRENADTTHYDKKVRLLRFYLKFCLAHGVTSPCYIVHSALIFERVPRTFFVHCSEWYSVTVVYRCQFCFAVPSAKYSSPLHSTPTLFLCLLVPNHIRVFSILFYHSA